MRALVAALLLAACPALAQVAAVDPLPADVLTADMKALETDRAALLAQREDLLGKIRTHNGNCSSVPSDSPLVAQCQASQAALVADVQRYRDALAAFNQRVAGAKSRHAQCEAAARQAETDRREIDKLRRELSTNQEELAEWTRLNDKAQSKAIEAAVKFTLGKYTENLKAKRVELSKLQRHAAHLEKWTRIARKQKTRLDYLLKLEATRAELGPTQALVLTKELAKATLDAKKAWDLSRNTLHQEFRVAAKHNAEIRELLQDREFREALMGSSLSPADDVLISLADAAVKEATELEPFLEHYGSVTGPAVRAGVFVRDAAYAALLSGLSTERVLQQSDVAGDLARATQSLQNRYKKSVDAVRDCRQAGFAR